MHLPIETYILDNGLRVTLSEDHTAPIVAVNLWYHVGSANERPDRTGFAHLFEHMLFQGSAHVAANEHFELVQRAGGTLNGSTWLERTNYYETLPSNQLSLALWLEADRMARLLPAMTQEKLDTQRDVVKNERRWSVDNQPYGTWWERLPALTFPPEHPFHHSLIGSMEHLSEATLEDVAAFFRTYYTPDNAVLSIVGDFDSADARGLVEQHFGSIPRGSGRPPLPDMSVPPVFGEWRREVVADDVMVPRLFLALRSPVLGAEQYFAASVAGAVLGSGRGSRLHQQLVRERQLASSISVFTFDLSKGTDLLIIDATARPGVAGDELERAVGEILEAMFLSGVTEGEVSRAKALICTDLVASLQSAQGRADRLSQFATYFGDPGLLNTQVDRYAAVSVDEVNGVIRERFGPDNRASLLYVPREGAGEASADAQGGDGTAAEVAR
ncbi:MAG TPA: pitrilysin family protein [Gemmatimonadaceae bacterium]|nr:pitrilysin family protein [Gemmatimonadaceae bacterium]